MSRQDGDRPARNNELPEGMTLECLDSLAELFNDRADVFVAMTNEEFAISAFKVVRGTFAAGVKPVC